MITILLIGVLLFQISILVVLLCMFAAHNTSRPQVIKMPLMADVGRTVLEMNEKGYEATACMTDSHGRYTLIFTKVTR